MKLSRGNLATHANGIITASDTAVLGFALHGQQSTAT
jgi:hypothetical protein